jgi:hypothetical protein
LLSNEPTDVLATKRLDARKKVEELQREVDELVSEAQKAAP